MGWCGIKMVLPDEDADKIFRFAEAELNLKQIDEDWCTHKRDKDNAVIDYYPEKEPPDRKSMW
jgi:hypothetical protein